MRYNKGKRIIADGVMGMKKQTALMNHWQLCQYLRKLHLPQVVPPPDLATLKLLQDWNGCLVERVTTMRTSCCLIAHL